MQDMAVKGRSYLTVGEKSGNCKLTTIQVEDIRRSTGRGVDLAKEYGVTKSTISVIRNRKSRVKE